MFKYIFPFQKVFNLKPEHYPGMEKFLRKEREIEIEKNRYNKNFKPPPELPIVETPEVLHSEEIPLEGEIDSLERILQQDDDSQPCGSKSFNAEQDPTYEPSDSGKKFNNSINNFFC